MALDPEIAAILKYLPKSPPIRSTDLATFRERINAATSAAPRLSVPLAKVEDRVIETGIGSIPVRVFTPNGAGPFPLIVHFHGGGFVIGDLNVSDAICRSLCSGVGAVVMTVEYRLAPEHPFPAANDDCWAALRWAAANAGEIGADAGRLALAGDSAGGNLCASMALRARDRGGPQIVAQFLMYPAPQYPEFETGSYAAMPDAPLMTTDDARFYWEQYLPNEASRKDPDACAIEAESLAGLPPTFVGIALLDPSTDGAVAFADALIDAGVETVKREYPTMPHGFYAWVGQVKGATEAMAEACEWLKSRLAAAKAAPALATGK